MARILIIGAVIGIAFTLFALVDASMSESSRARGVSKPVWVVLTVLLPVIGGLLWFTIGKGPVPDTVYDSPGDAHTTPRSRPTNGLSDSEVDKRMADLEQRLRDLDSEVYPGEDGPNDPNGHDG